MSIPVRDQLNQTLKNFNREVAEHGLTEAADQMWVHAQKLRTLLMPRQERGKVRELRS